MGLANPQVRTFLLLGRKASLEVQGQKLNKQLQPISFKIDDLQNIFIKNEAQQKELFTLYKTSNQLILQLENIDKQHTTIMKEIEAHKLYSPKTNLTPKECGAFKTFNVNS